MRRHLRFGLAAALVVTLAGCAAGTLRDLDRMKERAAAGDDAAVAATEVACTGGPGCAQAHAIKADACLARAQAASVDEREPSAACARASYTNALVALADHADVRVDAERLRTRRLEAIRLERDVAGLQRGLALNQELVAAAESFADAGGEPGVAAFYEANALGFEAAFGDVAAPCATLAEAVALAGEAGGATVDDAAAQLRRDLANLRRVEGCTE